MWGLGALRRPILTKMRYDIKLPEVLAAPGGLPYGRALRPLPAPWGGQPELVQFPVFMEKIEL